MNTMAGVRDLLRRVRGSSPPPPPCSERNAFEQPGNQWYEPALAGALTFAPLIVGGARVRDALAVLERLTPDGYAEYVLGFYRAGIDRFGDAWQYADINTALIGLAEALRPATYLEIGVRRGRSLAMVASQQPSCRIVGCDLFIANYANMDNPGPDFVRNELTRLGYSGDLEFVVGDSAVVLPSYLASHPDLYFDLITVDGDHSERGARVDLETVLPRLKVGGALVFDDVSNPSHPELLGVWQDTIVSTPRFSTFAFTDLGFGVAIAIRKA